MVTFDGSAVSIDDVSVFMTALKAVQALPVGGAEAHRGEGPGQRCGWWSSRSRRRWSTARQRRRPARGSCRAAGQEGGELGHGEGHRAHREGARPATSSPWWRWRWPPSPRLNYFVIGLPFGGSIQSTEQKITRTVAEQRRLDGEFIEKQAIANDLNRFRQEREMLEQRLREALAELPEYKNLDELLQMFQDRAQKSGLEISASCRRRRSSAGFYIQIPIEMKVAGQLPRDRHLPRRARPAPPHRERRATSPSTVPRK